MKDVTTIAYFQFIQNIQQNNFNHFKESTLFITVNNYLDMDIDSYFEDFHNIALLFKIEEIDQVPTTHNILVDEEKNSAENLIDELFNSIDINKI